MRFKICGFDPWVRKIPWRRAWQPTPVFLPGKSYGQRNWVGYGPWGHKESDMTEVTSQAHSQIWVNTVKYPLKSLFDFTWVYGNMVSRWRSGETTPKELLLHNKPIGKRVCAGKDAHGVEVATVPDCEDAWRKQRSSRRQMEDAG